MRGEASEMARAELLAAMRGAGLPQVEVARRMRVTQAWVSQILAPGHNLTLRTVERFAAALGRRVEIRVVPEIGG